MARCSTLIAENKIGVMAEIPCDKPEVNNTTDGLTQEGHAEVSVICIIVGIHTVTPITKNAAKRFCRFKRRLNSFIFCSLANMSMDARESVSPALLRCNLSK